MTFFYKFWKKARVYYTLSISRGGGDPGPRAPPGFATVYIHNKLNIVSYNSACIELLRSPLVSLYIHNLCASRREELAHVQRSWAVLKGNTTSKTYVVLLVVTALTSSVARLETYLFNCAFD